MTDGDRHVVQTAERLQTLNEISRVVSATLDLQALYDTIYQQIGRVMDTSQFFIALRQPSADHIDVPYLQEEGQHFAHQRVPYGDNTTSIIIDQGVSLLYNTADDYASFERSHGLTSVIVGDKDSASGIFVPLHTGSRTIGALSVQSPSPHAYTREDLQTLTVIAAQAAVAIENARLYAESQRMVQRMQVLLEVARTLTSSLDLSSVLDSILAGVSAVLPSYLAAVLMPNYRTGHLEIVSNIGHQAQQRKRSITIPFGAGITGLAFTRGEPVYVPDVHAFSGYIGDVEGHRSELAAPLKYGDMVVGVIDIEREGLDAFSPQERDLFLLFASQAAIAIENARLFADQQRRVDELHAVQSVVQKLTLLHDAPAVARLIDRELKTLIDYHACRIMVQDETANTLVSMDTEPSGPPLEIRVGEGVSGWIAANGQSLIVPNLLHDERATHIAGTPERDESMIGVPLIYQGKVRGVIGLTKLGADQFDANDLRLLEIVAAQAAIAFDRARLYDELRTQAVTDELTKLYNRRYLMERFREERSRALRNRHVLAVMMVDIDKFKRINDRYGHDAGDVVLKDVATVIRAVVRAEDIVARYGGEEFCVLLPEIQVDSVRQVAERLRVVVERRQLPPTAGAAHITASVGISLLHEGDQDAEVFSRADQAMYEVKRAGGNAVCMGKGGTFQFFGKSAT